MVREAELEEMEKKWKAQNEEIMRRSAALTEAEAAILRALMTLDTDKDGALRADEFRMAVKLLDEVT